MNNLTKAYDNILRAIALVVVIAFSVESCLFAAQVSRDDLACLAAGANCLRPVRLIEQVADGAAQPSAERPLTAPEERLYIRFKRAFNDPQVLAVASENKADLVEQLLEGRCVYVYGFSVVYDKSEPKFVQGNGFIREYQGVPLALEAPESMQSIPFCEYRPLKITQDTIECGLVSMEGPDTMREIVERVKTGFVSPGEHYYLIYHNESNQQVADCIVKITYARRLLHLRNDSAVVEVTDLQEGRPADSRLSELPLEELLLPGVNRVIIPKKWVSRQTEDVMQGYAAEYHDTTVQFSRVSNSPLQMCKYYYATWKQSPTYFLYSVAEFFANPLLAIMTVMIYYPMTHVAEAVFGVLAYGLFYSEMLGAATMILVRPFINIYTDKITDFGAKQNVVLRRRGGLPDQRDAATMHKLLENRRWIGHLQVLVSLGYFACYYIVCIARQAEPLKMAWAGTELFGAVIPARIIIICIFLALTVADHLRNTIQERNSFKVWEDEIRNNPATPRHIRENIWTVGGTGWVLISILRFLCYPLAGYIIAHIAPATAVMNLLVVAVLITYGATKYPAAFYGKRHKSELVITSTATGFVKTYEDDKGAVYQFGDDLTLSVSDPSAVPIKTGDNKWILPEPWKYQARVEFLRSRPAETNYFKDSAVETRVGRLRRFLSPCQRRYAAHTETSRCDFYQYERNKDAVYLISPDERGFRVSRTSPGQQQQGLAPDTNHLAGKLIGQFGFNGPFAEKILGLSDEIDTAFMHGEAVLVNGMPIFYNRDKEVFYFEPMAFEANSASCECKVRPSPAIKQLEVVEIRPENGAGGLLDTTQNGQLVAEFERGLRLTDEERINRRMFLVYRMDETGHPRPHCLVEAARNKVPFWALPAKVNDVTAINVLEAPGENVGELPIEDMVNQDTSHILVPRKYVSRETQQALTRFEISLDTHNEEDIPELPEREVRIARARTEAARAILPARLSQNGADAWISVYDMQPADLIRYEKRKQGLLDAVREYRKAFRYSRIFKFGEIGYLADAFIGGIQRVIVVLPYLFMGETLGELAKSILIIIIVAEAISTAFLYISHVRSDAMARSERSEELIKARRGGYSKIQKTRSELNMKKTWLFVGGFQVLETAVRFLLFPTSFNSVFSSKRRGFWYKNMLSILGGICSTKGGLMGMVWYKLFEGAVREKSKSFWALGAVGGGLQQFLYLGTALFFFFIYRSYMINSMKPWLGLVAAHAPVFTCAAYGILLLYLFPKFLLNLYGHESDTHLTIRSPAQDYSKLIQVDDGVKWTVFKFSNNAQIKFKTEVDFEPIPLGRNRWRMPDIGRFDPILMFKGPPADVTTRRSLLRGLGPFSHLDPAKGIWEIEGSNCYFKFVQLAKKGRFELEEGEADDTWHCYRFIQKDPKYQVPMAPIAYSRRKTPVSASVGMDPYPSEFEDVPMGSRGPVSQIPDGAPYAAPGSPVIRSQQERQINGGA